ncbi:hypothetical protein M2152_001540 [Microbacteriaceae bacterium SG_E_30_P1]|uniref:Uncharacterized protein n=1 Tax=Antiquaquibacter oligotrophicus TaxID=2880260 RepID=A0ABT6KPF9_9MICO|nr:hypothetical protein [Antiquaquibacter oligotrophicus]MDH6181358.1 hypothetical protein [Antiquaquibacter oligotrophicus]UDF12949.1 hypothetical protein LH407_12415 [Antiquaquibacter oligotrophicus]
MASAPVPTDAPGQVDAGASAILAFVFALAPFGLRALEILSRFLFGRPSYEFPVFAMVLEWTNVVLNVTLGPLAVIFGVIAMRHPDATERQLRLAQVGLLVGAFGTLLTLIGIGVLVFG